jgi:hypothetical protein
VSCYQTYWIWSLRFYSSRFNRKEECFSQYMNHHIEKNKIYMIVLASQLGCLAHAYAHYASASNNNIIPAGRPGSRASGAIMPPSGACRVDATRIVAFRHRHDKDMHGSDGDGYITHQQATDYTKRLAFFFLRDSGVSRHFQKSQKEGYSV